MACTEPVGYWFCIISASGYVFTGVECFREGSVLALTIACGFEAPSIPWHYSGYWLVGTFCPLGQHWNDGGGGPTEIHLFFLYRQVVESIHGVN